MAAYPYDSLTFVAKNVEGENLSWSISNPSLAEIVFQEGDTAVVRITTYKGNKEGFDIIYGELSKHIIINSL